MNRRGFFQAIAAGAVSAIVPKEEPPRAELSKVKDGVAVIDVPDCAEGLVVRHRKALLHIYPL
jgi:hypothetical protein